MKGRTIIPSLFHCNLCSPLSLVEMSNSWISDPICRVSHPVKENLRARVLFPTKDSHLFKKKKKKRQKNSIILKFSAKRRQSLLKVIVALAKTSVAPWALTALKLI